MTAPLAPTAAPWLTARARRDPDAPAVHADGDVCTWAMLARRVDVVARRLAALGVVAGDRVALVMEPSLRCIELVHAAQRAGLVLVVVNTRLTPPELAPVLAHADPALVLHDAAHAAALAAATSGTALRCVEAEAALDAVIPAATMPEIGVDLGAVQTILYTSGTTGRPKGVMSTHANHAASAAASRTRLGVAPDDRWLVALPLFHVGGLSIVMRSVLDGTPIVLHPRFDADAVWAAIVAERVTLLSVVPTMLHRLLGAIARAPARHALRGVLVGGAALDAALHARARDAGLPIAATYGLTEAASQVATAAVGDPPGAVGSPLPGTSVRIGDQDAAGCGEILVAGPTVMAGYFRDPAATASVLRDGWLHTGDVGCIDGAGRLRVLDRRSDLVVTGGENVYPSEVETVLLAHPAVAEAAVYGVADPEWGRRVEAAVVLRAGAAFDATALDAWCRTRLAGFKRPRAFVAVTSLPRTASGKLKRHALAAARP